MKSIIPTTISGEKMVTITQTEYLTFMRQKKLIDKLIRFGGVSAEEYYKEWENENE